MIIFVVLQSITQIVAYYLTSMHEQFIVFLPIRQRKSQVRSSIISTNPDKCNSFTFLLCFMIIFVLLWFITWVSIVFCYLTSMHEQFIVFLIIKQRKFQVRISLLASILWCNAFTFLLFLWSYSFYFDLLHEWV